MWKLRHISIMLEYIYILQFNIWYETYLFYLSEAVNTWKNYSKMYSIYKEQYNSITLKRWIFTLGKKSIQHTYMVIYSSKKIYSALYLLY